MMSRALVFFCSCVFLVAAHQHKQGVLKTPLSSHTNTALRTLRTLPSHCSRTAEHLILAEEPKYQELFANCSRSRIAFHAAELLTDTAYFAFDLATHGYGLIDDVKICLKKKCFLEKIVCVLERGPNGSWDALDLGLGAAAYALELLHVVPKIVKEVKHCRHSKVEEYRTFLEHQVQWARRC